MSLRVYAPSAIRVRGEADATVPTGAYMERLVKLVPAEAVAVYPLLFNEARSLADPTNRTRAVALVSWIILIIVIVLRWQATATPERGPQWLAVGVAADFLHHLGLRVRRAVRRRGTPTSLAAHAVGRPGRAARSRHGQIQGPDREPGARVLDACGPCRLQGRFTLTESGHRSNIEIASFSYVFRAAASTRAAAHRLRSPPPQLHRQASRAGGTASARASWARGDSRPPLPDEERANKY